VIYSSRRLGAGCFTRLKQDGWRVTRTGSFWDLGNSTINRDEFSMRLEQCFNGYPKELSVEPNWQSPIWTAVGKKIWWLIRVS
jgi:hypothetical protein